MSACITMEITMPKFTAIKTLSITAAALAGTAMLAATPAAAGHHKEMASETASPNLVEIAQSTGVHETLVAAVVAADLAGTLAGDGAFTVFAPTDTAFAKLPDGTIASLVQPENKDTLTGILTYHVVGGRITSDMILEYIRTGGGEARIQTLSGGILKARLSGDTVVITDAAGRTAAVTQVDVSGSNGVIHVTDGVFLPG